MAKKKWRLVKIRPMPYNITADKKGRWQVYSYEVTEDNPEREPLESEITKHGSDLDYLKAEEMLAKVPRV